jgi:EAL domain-containing protein (putative c-di-GMP-specific phosphodiesterase class I)/ActR/RegA family two-component response regulator
LSAIAPGTFVAYVLDDDPGILKLVCRLLGRYGVEAHPFTDAEELYPALNRRRPGLLVLDLALGRSDAIEVIRHLDVMGYEGKVLLISGRDASMLREAHRIGSARGLAMLPPLHKPFLPEDFAASLAAKTEPREGGSQASVPASALQVDAADALENGWLELWYQPKFDLAARRACGAEALLRLRHPDHGVLGPANFLPASGDPLHARIAEFVVRRAAEDWGRLAAHGLFMKLAINMPVSVISMPGFVGLMRDLLPVDQAFPGLVVELTEDEVIAEPALVKEVAAQLRLYDVSLSIDDFGTAHSALSHFLDLSFAELKLDRRFVGGCAHDPAKTTLCRTIVDLAHRFEVATCAEGVEGADDLAFLTEIGCDCAQANYLAPPVPPDELATCPVLLDTAIPSRLSQSLQAHPDRLAG